MLNQSRLHCKDCVSTAVSRFIENVSVVRIFVSVDFTPKFILIVSLLGVVILSCGTVQVEKDVVTTSEFFSSRTSRACGAVRLHIAFRLLPEHSRVRGIRAVEHLEPRGFGPGLEYGGRLPSWNRPHLCQPGRRWIRERRLE